MRFTRKILGLATLGSALVLGGCGGDDGNGGSSGEGIGSTSVPDSVGASSATFLSYLATLSGSDETSEPLTIRDSFNVPADDANGPQPVG